MPCVLSVIRAAVVFKPAEGFYRPARSRKYHLAQCSHLAREMGLGSEYLHRPQNAAQALIVQDIYENAETYERLEKQRAFERKIRELKRRKIASKDIDQEEYTKVTNKLHSTNEQFNKWLKENNLTRDYNREYY